MKECCRFKTGKCAAETNPQPEENFAKDRKRKDGLTPHCKSCLAVYRNTNKEQRNETIKAWRKKHPEKMKAYRVADAEKNKNRTKKWREANLLQSRYGISQDDWNKLFESQQGKCAICGTHASELAKILHVDHCHTTKKVRGLLCSMCNKAIGLFGDNVETLNTAVAYLIKEG